jgi:hypothetical protein
MPMLTVSSEAMGVFARILPVHCNPRREKQQEKSENPCDFNGQRQTIGLPQSPVTILAAPC